MPAARYAREIPRRYRLEAARCTQCERVSFPPRKICPGCRGRSFEPTRLSREGTLLTWTVVHVAPEALALQAPYIVAIVELGEGVRVTAQLADCEPDELEVGMKVHHTFRRIGSEAEHGILLYGYKFTLAR